MKQNSQNRLEDIIARLEDNTSGADLQANVRELKQYADEQKKDDLISKKAAIGFFALFVVVLIGLGICLGGWMNLREDLKCVSGSTSPEALVEKYDSIQNELVETQKRFVNFANSAKKSAPIDIDFETWTCRPNAEWELAKEVLTDKDGYMVQLITLEGDHTVTYPELIEQCDSLQGLVNDAIEKGYRPVYRKRVELGE